MKTNHFKMLLKVFSTAFKQCKSEKLGLFGLRSYANIDIVEIFYVLGSRHLRHDKVALLNIYKETF